MNTFQLFVAAATVLAASLISPTAGHFNCPPPGFQPFNCTPTSAPPPSDVLHLHPSHISAVMALGDSITAGFAMQDGPLEYRGTVYSTGGDEGALTVGNFLKQYNSKLEGTATGTTIPLTKRGKGFNFAVSEARIRDVPGQIQRMAEKMQKPEYKHLFDEWKLLTIFIGANDICECKSMTAEQFEQQLDQALTLVHKTFPKTFVNIMTIFNISMVWDVSRDKLYCEAAVPVLHECSCLDNNATQRQLMDDLGLQINNVTRTLAKKYAALNDPKFTVVNQPAVEHVAVNTFPHSIAEYFLSDLDCFHPSLCSDQGFAVALWNNMFSKPGNKSSTLDPLNPPVAYCPKPTDIIQ